MPRRCLALPRLDQGVAGPLVVQRPPWPRQRDAESGQLGEADIAPMASSAPLRCRRAGQPTLSWIGWARGEGAVRVTADFVLDTGIEGVSSRPVRRIVVIDG